MRKIMLMLLPVLFLAAPSLRLHSAPLDCIFEHYSSEDGLSHNSIADIHQDSRGFIWLCTWYGLSRFDGNSFVNYSIHPGDCTRLSHNRLLSIDEDAQGYLWIITYDYRLFRFDPRLETFSAVPEDVPGIGLSNMNVRLLHCDRRGNTWISFQDAGLCRISPSFAAKLFFSVSSNEIGKHVSEIYEDSEGTVYAVSENGIFSISGDSPELVSRISDICGFAEFGSRVYFLGGDYLLALDKTSGKQQKVSLVGCSAGMATAVTVTGTGDRQGLYVGFTDNAIAQVDTSAFTLELHKTAMGRTRYLFPDSEGLLWIATDMTGIWSWNPARGRFRHYEHSRNVRSYYADTLAMVQEHEGRLWIKMNNYGFGYYDRESDSVIPLSNVKEQKDSRFVNGVACFEVDRTGVLWMSTAARGLERVTVITPRLDVVVPPSQSSDQLSASEVRALYRDRNDNIWVATKSSELFIYSPDMSSCTRYPGSEEFGNVYSIFEDSSSNIWLGTKADGLVKLCPLPDGGYRAVHFRHDPSDPASLSCNSVYSVAQDREGRIWIGTYGDGLCMLPSPESTDFHTVYDSFPSYPLESGDRVRYVHCMADGRMLVATVGGLVWFWPQENPELTEFNLVRKVAGDISSIGNNDVIYIFDDNGGNTWLCSFGGGIDRISFDSGEVRCEVISAADGLSSNIVLSGLCGENGDIWLASETGISRISHVDGSITNYTQYDGVVPTTFSEAACTMMKDGSILFGTYNNVYRINPEDFVYKKEPLMLSFSGISIDGVRVPDPGYADIPHDYSFFRIDFSSLNYRIQGRVNYSYMLEGYDKKWISGHASSATYSRIPPGKYVFKVSASSSHGDVSEAETISMDVRIRPSVWTCTAAKISYAVIFILAAWALSRMLLTSMRLRNDMKLEQNLNALKARFFTNISHELRTPLTLILGGIDEVRKNTPEGDRNTYGVNLVYKNARRMMTLVDQLLDIRRIVNGKMRLRVTQLDAVKLCRSVYDDFKDMAAERGMEMLFSHSVDSLKIWGDAGRLEALVYNLMSNAFKYTSDGGKIELGIYYRDGEDSFTVMVKDNGIGVPKEKRTAIFEQFVQGADAVFKGMASSGIGLSFCKEIVEMHGGRIWVESEVGKGSAFYVSLPVDRDHFTEETAEFIEADASDASPAQDSYGLSKYKVKPTYPDGALKVLVVEDNAELKVYMYNCLINRYEVRDASNGKEALQVIESGWMPDMIVTDLMMPEMDGIGLINRIRADFSTSHIPIIMITAKHENDTHLKAMKYGADGYITKPFTMELLIARMENLLDRRRALISSLSSSDHSAEQKDGSNSKYAKVEFAPEEIVITDRDEELIKKVMKWLEENVSDSEVTVDNLASYVGMGRTSMYNKLKGLTGKSPVELIQEYRLENATYYLKSGQYSVSETSYKVGFSDPGYFSRTFKKRFGISPADYIKEHRSDAASDSDRTRTKQ